MKYRSYLNNHIVRIVQIGGLMTGLCGLSSLATISSLRAATAGDNRILGRIESGEVIATKAGASFVVQGLVKQDFDKVNAAFKDFKKLPLIFKNVGWARPFTNKSPDDGRHFLYLKTRGLMDGLGLLMEVRTPDSDPFVNARELSLSGEVYRRREISSEMNLVTDPSHLQLQKELAEAAKEGDGGRDIGQIRSIILEGPMHPVMQLPNVRFTISLGVAPYSYTPKGAAGKAAGEPVTASYLILKVGVGNQVVKEFIGDIHGFGDQRLTAASLMGQKVLGSLREQLERL